MNNPCPVIKPCDDWVVNRSIDIYNIKIRVRIWVECFDQIKFSNCGLDLIHWFKSKPQSPNLIFFDLNQIFNSDLCVSWLDLNQEKYFLHNPHLWNFPAPRRRNRKMFIAFFFISTLARNFFIGFDTFATVLPILSFLLRFSKLFHGFWLISLSPKIFLLIYAKIDVSRSTFCVQSTALISKITTEKFLLFVDLGTFFTTPKIFFARYFVS